MENENYNKKIQQLEDDYEREKRCFEEELEQTTLEKHRFNSLLEETVERLHSTFSRQEDHDSLDLRHAYHMVEQAQEEGVNLVNNLTYKIECVLEETEQQYKKQVTIYEEERIISKKEEDLND